MERLTINGPVLEMGMVELAYNCCYSKDGMARYRDFDKDIDARAFARQLMQKYGFWQSEDDKELLSNDDIFDEAMIENLYYGEDSLEGLIALFYRNLWAMADLRERLKKYEDTSLTPERILEIDKLYQELSKEVMQHRKAAESNGWIPCSERLPEVIEQDMQDLYPHVLVYAEEEDEWNIHVGIYGMYKPKEWVDAHDPTKIIENVIAWQPLPEPYKVVKTTEEQKNSAPDKDADVTDITINYSNGTKKVVQKGCICGMRLNEDETCTMDFTMVNVPGKELEHIVMGFLHLGEEMGLFDNEGGYEN